MDRDIIYILPFGITSYNIYILHAVSSDSRTRGAGVPVLSTTVPAPNPGGWTTVG